MPDRDMKIQITELYIYPIKSLRPVSVRSTQLRREGLQYDRRFMLLKAEADGQYTNIHVVRFPGCALFAQALDGDEIVVTHLGKGEGEGEGEGEGAPTLRVPLDPVVEDLQRNGTVDILLFGSAARAFRVGEKYDAWFSARLGYRAVLVYIGDNRRAVLAHAPPSPSAPSSSKKSSSWFSYAASFLPSYISQRQQGNGVNEEGGGGKEGLAFNEAAPFLVTSRASLRDVEARMMPNGEAVDMIKFRPNIVVDVVPCSTSPSSSDETEVLSAWDEDFWGEIAVGDPSSSTTTQRRRLALTANCARCVSVDVDYATGRRTDVVLKRLMRDRRVDAGSKWSPIFGRYAFLLPPSARENIVTAADVAVGDEVEVTKRLTERNVWAWPT